MNQQDFALFEQNENEENEIELAIAKADAILGNRVASPLKDMRILPFPASLEEIPIENAAWLFRLDRLVIQKDTRIEEKLTNVIKAIHLSGASFIIMLRCLEGQCSFYLGVVNKSSHKSELIAMKRILESGIKGNFPGTHMTELSLRAVRDEIDSVFSDHFETQCVTSVTVAASGREQDKDSKFSLRGIENMIDSLEEATFTMFVIADPISSDHLREIRAGYENLGAQLSSFQKSDISVQKGGSVTISHNTSESLSESLSKSLSMTQSYTKTDGWSKSVLEAGHYQTGQKVVGKIAGKAVSGIVGNAMPLLKPAANSLMNAMLGGSENASEARGISETGGSSEQRGISRQRGDSFGNSSSESRTVTLHYENYTIRGLLERIDGTLKLLNSASVYGAYQCAAYVLSSNASANLLVASQYHSLMCGNSTALQITDMNTWTDPDSVKAIKQYLRHFSHPIFEGGAYEDYMTPAVMVGSTDLSYHIALPHKSIKGLTVTELRPFGRSVRSLEFQRDEREAVRLGNIFHMGDIDSQPVFLDSQSLSMHTFITGSTGSGKSNAVYQILRELNKLGISYLVIEPAKGEYKNIFGNSPDVSVYGTNPQFADLLQINPFKFPKGIHVLEHIDRLIEIFNVCWPMYAAMPAVLKEAVLQSYEACGWDLRKSNNNDGAIFPNFRDVLAQLEDVLKQSSYDQEVKNNYKGSLETRIRSLTNGLNGEIFCSGETDNRSLFDRNAIVDLSRIGSVETKSLIMGILIMRLNERRMSKTDGMNMPLRHVTVLEEAHNILKRNAGGGGSEGSDMAGKSVEMLSNSIAEIRTYGEGFIIADQSPAAVDASAIRNTNTKIIMRLPDESDRRLAGKSVALKDEQLDEIAKFPKGVAVVYQNDWLEPVLCKIHKFPGEYYPYQFTPSDSHDQDEENRWLLNQLLEFLLKDRMRKETMEVNLEKIKKLIPDADFPSALKPRLLRLIDEYQKDAKISVWEKRYFRELDLIITDLLNIQKRLDILFRESNNIEDFNNSLFYLIKGRVKSSSIEFITAIAQCLMENLCLQNQSYHPRYEAWAKSILLKGGRLIS